MWQAVCGISILIHLVRARSSLPRYNSEGFSIIYILSLFRVSVKYQFRRQAPKPFRALIKYAFHQLKGQNQ